MASTHCTVFGSSAKVNFLPSAEKILMPICCQSAGMRSCGLARRAKYLPSEALATFSASANRPRTVVGGLAGSRPASFIRSVLKVCTMPPEYQGSTLCTLVPEASAYMLDFHSAGTNGLPASGAFLSRSSR